MADSGRTFYGGGAAAAANPPDYVFDGVTGLWSVTPGQNPGCTKFGLAGDDFDNVTTPGEYLQNIPLVTALANEDVAALQPNGYSIRPAAAGLYLIALRGYAVYAGAGAAATPETHVVVATSGTQGTPIQSVGSNIHPDVMNNDGVNFAFSQPVLWSPDVPASDLSVDLYSLTHPWSMLLELTIVRLD